MPNRNVDENAELKSEAQVPAEESASAGAEELELPLTLQEKLDSLPTDPGVYQYSDRDGKVIYVGKAKNLRNRVRSYFQQGRPKDAKTQALVRKIVDVEVIVTDSAVEALILEDTLIKKLRPRYNVMLRDDKTYPYIRITSEPYPRVFATRKVIRDGSKYFGPYTDVKYVRNLLKTLRSIFPIRSCDWNLNAETIAAGRFKVCLDYHIGKCEGPCEGLVAQIRYAEMIDQVRQVLRGRTRELERVLEDEMTFLAEAMRFEEAATMRNRLQKLREYSGRQKVVIDEPVDRDIVAFAAEDDDACAVILRVRDGRLVGKQHHYFSGVLHLPEPVILANIIERHYISAEEVPEEVLLPIEPGDEDEVLERFLSDRRGEGRVRITVPKIGDKQKLVSMAQTNARFLLDELKLQRMKRSDMVPRPVQSLQRDLSLKSPPRRIECFDNSNIHGTDPVSSMVCFVDGRPRRSEYRKFKVRTVVGPDDFATMKEVVSRRYARVMKEGWALPDLVVIDGGKGQVSAATEAMAELGLEHIPLIGLAKRLEEIVLPGQRDTILLPKSSSGLRLLQHIRDEAHRFAIEFHRSLRSRRTLQTELSQIPGVGPKTVQKIFEKFGSVRGVQSTTVEALQAELGPRTGQAVWEYFQSKVPAEVADEAPAGSSIDDDEIVGSELDDDPAVDDLDLEDPEVDDKLDDPA
ncbi:MAG TPA: excinuclease ABC subunit UvrC [Candidatus Kapabacteria bacterium]|nr:excinuclease ABC subunit UvrC [Candidatus Kapabacteria bacterium]